MAITYSTAYTDFDAARYEVIRWLEEEGGNVSLTPYQDRATATGGYATIGAGFLITSHAREVLDAMEHAQVSHLPILKAVGTWDGAKWVPRTFATHADAQLALDKALREASGNPVARFEFASAAQVRNAFDDIVIKEDGKVLSFVVTNRPNGNRERLALLSLAYNGMLGGESPALQQALIDGDRAEAWFQIRYGSNPKNLPGVAKRRYFESSLFGLYADPNNPTEDEARQAYRTLQLHRAKIVDYEKRHGYWTDAAGTVAGTTRDSNGRLGLDAANGADYAGILAFLPRGHAEFAIEAFDPAKQRLFAMIPEFSGLNPADYLATNIYLDPGRIDSRNPIDPSHRGVLDARYDVNRVERNARDILIGEAGDDWLLGGKGDDVLIGGAGNDTYYYREGDGNDRIIDSDGEGRIIIQTATGNL